MFFFVLGGWGGNMKWAARCKLQNL